MTYQPVCKSNEIRGHSCPVKVVRSKEGGGESMWTWVAGWLGDSPRHYIQTTVKELHQGEIQNVRNVKSAYR